MPMSSCIRICNKNSQSTRFPLGRWVFYYFFCIDDHFSFDLFSNIPYSAYILTLQKRKVIPMFCLKCGKSLPNDARFCDGCGTPIRQTDPFTAASGPGSPKPPQQPLGEAFTPPSHNAAPSSHPEENPSNSISSGSYPPCNSPSPQNSHSKKGLIVGLSIGGSVLLILLVVVILFVSGVFGSDTSPSVSDTSVSGSKTSEPSTESTEESKQNLSNSHPVLEITGIQLTYGEKMDSVEKKFPDMEKSSPMLFTSLPTRR